MNIDDLLKLLPIFFGSNILVVLGTHKYMRRKEKFKAEQEAKTAESMSIKNTNDVISLYKKALEDIAILNKEKELELNKKIEDQDSRLKTQKKLLEEQSELIKTQTKTLNEMKLVQAKQELEIESLKKLATQDCNSCLFSKDCMKRLAKTNA